MLDGKRQSIPRSYFTHARTSKIDKFRIASMALLNLAILVHVILYHFYGHTRFGHHDIGDLFWLLKYGSIRLGLALILAAVAVTMIYGRFFCGWACHMGGWQEFGRWIIYTFFRYRPKLLYSRVTRYMPVVMLTVVFYGVYLVWADKGFPKKLFFELPDRPVWEDTSLEASVTVLLIFTILTPLFFGSRAVCRYCCPFGAVFRFLNKFSKGAVRKVKECVRCMNCSKTCTMGIDVSYEINKFGRVVSDDCIKCLRCTQACDTETIKYGFKTLAPLVDVRPMRVNMTSFVPEMILMVCGVGFCLLGQPDEVLGTAAMGLCVGMALVYLYHFAHGKLADRINAGRLTPAVVEGCSAGAQPEPAKRWRAPLGEVDVHSGNEGIDE